MLHTVLGGEQQIRRSDGGTIIPVELLQLDGPDGAVLVGLGGLSQIVILVAVIINGNEVGADQIHDGCRIQVILAPDIHAHGSTVQAHLYGAAGLGTCGSFCFAGSAAGCQGKHQAERQHECKKFFHIVTSSSISSQLHCNV